MRDSWKRMTLEDGEVVVQLRGVDGDPSWPSNWPSDLAHAGHWGKGVDYIYSRHRSPGRQAAMLLDRFPELVDRSGDYEVLLLGPCAVIERVIAKGPSWARPRLKRPASSAAHLAKYRANAAHLAKLRAKRPRKGSEASGSRKEAG